LINDSVSNANNKRKKDAYFQELYDEAISLCQEALENSPNEVDVHEILTLSLQYQFKYDQSLRSALEWGKISGPSEKQLRALLESAYFLADSHYVEESRTSFLCLLSSQDVEDPIQSLFHGSFLATLLAIDSGIPIDWTPYSKIPNNSNYLKTDVEMLQNYSVLKNRKNDHREKENARKQLIELSQSKENENAILCKILLFLDNLDNGKQIEAQSLLEKIKSEHSSEDQYFPITASTILLHLLKNPGPLTTAEDQQVSTSFKTHPILRKRIMMFLSNSLK